MSESCQYIPIEKVFEMSQKLLNAGGYLMMCDASSLIGTQASCPKAAMTTTNFCGWRSLARSRDRFREAISLETIRKSLEIANDWADKILLGADILTEKFRQRNPFLWKIACWFGHGKYEKASYKARFAGPGQVCGSQEIRVLPVQADRLSNLSSG